jgi:hypothetical protein
VLEKSSHVPDEAAELPRDRGNDEIGVFAARAEAAVFASEPQLRFPGEVADARIERLRALLDDGTDLGGSSTSSRSRRRSRSLTASTSSWKTIC